MRPHTTIAALAGVAVAIQLHPNTPACGMSATMSAFASSGCDFSDVTCLCQNQDFLDALTNRVPEACTDLGDQNLFYHNINQLCSGQASFPFAFVGSSGSISPASANGLAGGFPGGLAGGFPGGFPGSWSGGAAGAWPSGVSGSWPSLPSGFANWGGWGGFAGWKRQDVAAATSSAEAANINAQAATTTSSATGSAPTASQSFTTISNQPLQSFVSVSTLTGNGTMMSATASATLLATPASSSAFSQGTSSASSSSSSTSDGLPQTRPESIGFIVLAAFLAAAGF